jgi:hypothetical protein
MPTLEELHARLQMEENFQIGEHRVVRSDLEEALVMLIWNVVRRRFPQNPQPFSNYSQAQMQGNHQIGRPASFSGQEIVCHRCHRPGHTARN